MKEKDFIQFLQYSLDETRSLPENIKDFDWKDMITWAEQQAIVGVVFEGIKRADKALCMPFNTLTGWIGYAQQIEMQNRIVNKRCVELTEQLRNEGYDCCILKGQGNAIMYPNPYSRTPGDIDIWVKAQSDGRCKKGDVIEYAKKQDPKAEARYYHVEYQWKEVSVELHFMPGIMNNPIYNRRLQRFYRKMVDGECMMAELPDEVGEIPVPTNEFNLVFQMAHIMHHFFDEGIGLRQMIDYYYLLRKAKEDGRCQMADVKKTLKYLNLYKFAGAVMYIMKEMLGLDEKYLIVPIDERRGRTLLKEILKGGNFGQHSGLTNHSTGGKYLVKTLRNLHFIREYPAEALCEPIFRTWHFFWRMAH